MQGQGGTHQWCAAFPDVLPLVFTSFFCASTHTQGNTSAPRRVDTWHCNTVNTAPAYKEDRPGMLLKGGSGDPPPDCGDWVCMQGTRLVGRTTCSFSAGAVDFMDDGGAGASLGLPPPKRASTVACFFSAFSALSFPFCPPLSAASTAFTSASAAVLAPALPRFPSRFCGCDPATGAFSFAAFFGGGALGVGAAAAA